MGSTSSVAQASPFLCNFILYKCTLCVLFFKRHDKEGVEYYMLISSAYMLYNGENMLIFIPLNLDEILLLFFQMESSTTILVTGAAGYVGTHVIAELVQEGYRVVALDCRQAALQCWFSQYHFQSLYIQCTFISECFAMV